MNIPDSGHRPASSPPGYGAAAKVMRKAGLADAHPGHQVLRELVEAGVPTADFEQIAVEAVTRDKGFAWALAALKGRREDAARGYRPAKRDHAAELREWAPMLVDPRFADALGIDRGPARDASFERPRIPNGRDVEDVFDLEDWALQGRVDTGQRKPTGAANGTPADIAASEMLLLCDTEFGQPAAPRRASKSKRASAAPMQDAAGQPPRTLKLIRATDVSPTPSLYADELVERVLGRKMMSCLYGPSNAGKSYVALDMACAVALGRPWMGRRTRRGLVLYLATEGGASVCDRVKAYRIEREAALDLLAIVPNAIDLRDESSNAALLDVIERAEMATGEKVALIVADTLAAMTPGGDENSGKDMGLVIQRAQGIIQRTGAHWLWVHHTGKDTAKGMRGWSGMFAALDTAIALDDKQVLTIEKQRDLPGNGDRYAFHLRSVHIGRTDFGVERFACVVEAKRAPAKKAGKVVVTGPAAAICDLLRLHPAGMTRADIVRALRGGEGCSKPNVSKTITNMIAVDQLIDAEGSVRLPPPADSSDD